jgi:hypothetical protein
MLIALVLVIPAFSASPALAQDQSRTFPETGKTVRATFYTYWQNNGGLAQQGYPISDELQEVSDTDGKTYTVQYFERAVFELHPEFAGTPNEVLLQLLGVFLYQQKYAGNAPNQSPNNEAGSQAFPETGKRVGGTFLTYWTNHGGLRQQGFPISDEFTEVSELDGKSYKVQYFERAVFEFHPEFAGTPNEVLLSQLGTFRYRQKYLSPTPVPASPTAVPVPPTATTPPLPVPPTNTPVPPAQPTNTTAPAGPCAGIPPSSNDILILPSNCEKAGTGFVFGARGFQPHEHVGVYLTRPDGSVNGAPFQVETDGEGYAEPVTFSSGVSSQQGIWAITFEGVESHTVVIGYFKLLAP